MNFKCQTSKFPFITPQTRENHNISKGNRAVKFSLDSLGNQF
jgi:hypothetical protein